MNRNGKHVFDLHRKPVGAFFRWETPGEPIAVHFQLNIVDLLQRELVTSNKCEAAGLLLGRVEGGRKPAFIVEDYEPTPCLSADDVSDPVSANIWLLGAMVARWQSMPEKRLSVLGFYRGSKHSLALDKVDLEILSRCPTSSERLFLYIEPRVGEISEAILSLVQNDTITWSWHSVPFRRTELLKSNRGITTPKATSRVNRPSSQEKSINAENDSEGLPLPPRNIGPLILRTGTVILTMLAIIGISIRPTVVGGIIHSLMGTSETSQGPSALGFNVQRDGRDWRLSWDRNAPIILKSQSGRLLITDGITRKDLALDMDELRTGMITYTPVTDNVILRLELMNGEARLVASESARILAGMPPLLDQDIPEKHSPVAKTAVDTINSSRPRPASPVIDISAESRASANADFATPLELRTPKSTSAMEPLLSPVVPRFDGTIMGPSEPLPTETLSANGSGSSEPQLTAASSFFKSEARNGQLTPPKAKFRTEPVYPNFAKLANISGKVEVRLLIDARGDVQTARLINGSPLLASAVLSAVRGWKYYPAQRDGVPTESEVVVNFIFKVE